MNIYNMTFIITRECMSVRKNDGLKIHTISSQINQVEIIRFLMFVMLKCDHSLYVQAFLHFKITIINTR